MIIHKMENDLSNDSPDTMIRGGLITESVDPSIRSIISNSQDQLLQNELGGNSQGKILPDNLFTDSQERLLTNSQENAIMEDLPFGSFPYTGFSDIELPDSQKYPPSYPEDSKNMLHLTLQAQQTQQLQLQHQHIAQHSGMEQCQIENQMHAEALGRLQQQQPLQQQIPLFQPMPPAQNPIMSKEEFPGRYNFQLILNSQEGGKHWVFSEKLTKVFIHMEEVLPLHFQWTPPEDGLWLRATLVYKLEQYRSDPVKRCHNHMAPTNNSNRDMGPDQARHVIRCIHNIAQYKEENNGHLSVMIPLGTPAAGMTNVPVHYKFYCKNSCTGMNRRATEVIFTLENDQSEVLGRRKIEVRICSCPKRDKDKEELDSDPKGTVVSKKRKVISQATHAVIPSKKKIAVDHRVYKLSFEVVGYENAYAVLKTAFDSMAGSAVKSGSMERFKGPMDRVQNEIDKLE